jgi:S-adenosylmethionine decarboxylase
VHALGTHLLVELRDCNSKLLNDLKKVESLMVSAAKVASATVIESRFHKFNPFGISGVVVIAESHLTIHTWPEYEYAAVDIFTCGDVLKPEIAANYLVDKFQSKNPSVMEIKRGMLSREGQLPHKPLKNFTTENDRSKELQVVS